MALTLSINLEEATFTDLTALVESARTAGVETQTSLDLEGSILTVTVESPSSEGRAPQRKTDAQSLDPAHLADTVRNTVNQGGDTALRLMGELLNGNKQNPPFGNR